VEKKSFSRYNANFPKGSALFGIIDAIRDSEKLYAELEKALEECRRGKKKKVNPKKDKKPKPSGKTPWWLISAVVGFNPGAGSPPKPPKDNE